MKHKDEATPLGERYSAGGPGQPTETALFAQAQAGCRTSLNRLMAIHDNLVHTVVRRQALGCLPFSEALQAGRIGLWRAIQGYDPERGLAFSTYAWKPIMHRIWREVKLAERAYGHGRQPLRGGSFPAQRLSRTFQTGWEKARNWPVPCGSLWLDSPSGCASSSWLATA